jgi:ABC-type multidrug transport system ATPase subunit
MNFFFLITIKNTINYIENCFGSAHSMEEAEVLCDRLGIFVDGSFQCLGNPKEVPFYSSICVFCSFR